MLVEGRPRSSATDHRVVRAGRLLRHVVPHQARGAWIRRALRRGGQGCVAVTTASRRIVYVFRVTGSRALETMRSTSSIDWGPIWPYSSTVTGVNSLSLSVCVCVFYVIKGYESPLRKCYS